MNNEQRVNISTLAFRKMTLAQFESLQANVLAEGKWENQSYINIWFDGLSSTLFVDVYGEAFGEVRRSILLGIEKDGYCHS